MNNSKTKTQIVYPTCDEAFPVFTEIITNKLTQQWKRNSEFWTADKQPEHRIGMIVSKNFKLRDGTVVTGSIGQSYVWSKSIGRADGQSESVGENLSKRDN